MTEIYTRLNIVMEIKSLQIKLLFISFVFFVCVSTFPFVKMMMKCTKFLTLGISFKDIDECTSNNHNCDINAFCNNTEGSHNCTCKPGYSGDGSNCTGNDVFYSFFVYRHKTEVFLKLDFVIENKSFQMKLCRPYSFLKMMMKCTNLSHVVSFS